SPSTTTSVSVQVSPAGTSSEPTVVLARAPAHGVLGTAWAGATAMVRAADITARPMKIVRTVGSSLGCRAYEAHRRTSRSSRPALKEIPHGPVVVAGDAVQHRRRWRALRNRHSTRTYDETMARVGYSAERAQPSTQRRNCPG